MLSTKQIAFLSLFIAVALICQSIIAQPQWPKITNENKPWTRWWWEGSAVSPGDLTAAMEKYSKAGLGGLELTVVYGVKGSEQKFIDYLSPKWMDMFVFTLKESQRLGLGIDMDNTSGWPFGGPWVDSSYACRNINYKTYSLKTGESLTENVNYIQQPLLRAVGVKPYFSELKYPVGKNRNLQVYALDQVQFKKELPLNVLMAYSDAGKTLDLTNKVDASGKLHWTAPSGNWTIYAIFEGWHGKQVERAGPGGEGDVIDHFSGEAVSAYLKHFDTAFKGYDTKLLRAFFNDSYEVDDSKGQADWTPEFFNEFKIRRGYDLKDDLPALFQKDTPEKNERVLCDYRETISDLLLEKFTQTWASWAHKQGKIIRNQSHGSPANILDLYAASDIPETEGTDILGFKFASSAANVTGKKLVSSESATWLNEHFQSSLSDVKFAVDRYFLGGVNHIFYHGTCFSPRNAAWPGWLFYASVEFTPQNSFWNDFPALNNYIAHVQSFLQTGKPQNDILLYLPFYDSYAHYDSIMLDHFNGINRGFYDSSFKECAKLMQDNGYSFDYISDMQLKNVSNSDSGLLTGSSLYKTIVLPACKYIPLETFEKAITLARHGATVIFCDDLPKDVPGLGNLELRRKAFADLKDELLFKTEASGRIRQASLGKGTILCGNNLMQLLEYVKIQRESMVDSGIQFNRRKTDRGILYFVANRNEKSFQGWLPVSLRGKSAAIYDAMTEKEGMADTRISRKGKMEIYLRLEAHESAILEIYNATTTGKPYKYFQEAGVPQKITGKWSIRFTEGGPVLPEPVLTDRLISWTNFGSENVKSFSGTALYTLTFSKPSGNANAWLLNLGKVCESARISLNGKELATLIGPVYKLMIDNTMLKQENVLEVKVSNLMANRIAYMDRQGIEWKIFYNTNFAARFPENRNKEGLFDASKWLPAESGLLGPVTITPAGIVKNK